MAYLESRKTGERYPYNPDLARHPDMFVTDENGEVPPEVAPPEPEPVRKPAPPKLNRPVKPAAEPQPTPVPTAPVPVLVTEVSAVFEPTPLDSLPDAKNILGEDFVQ